MPQPPSLYTRHIGFSDLSLASHNATCTKDKNKQSSDGTVAKYCCTGSICCCSTYTVYPDLTVNRGMDGFQVMVVSSQIHHYNARLLSLNPHDVRPALCPPTPSPQQTFLFIQLSLNSRAQLAYDIQAEWSCVTIAIRKKKCSDCSADYSMH